MKKEFLRTCAALAITLMILMVSFFLTGCNMQVVDTHWDFDRAIIFLPDGKSIEGKCQSWKDFDESDMIQVKIDGKTYLTHSSNVVLIDD